MDNYITEDGIVNWVESMGGFLNTRKKKVLNYDGSLVCLTGVDGAVGDFFRNHIKLMKPDTITLITIEADVVSFRSEWVNNPKLKNWFSWNVTAKHPKVKCIPIGLNYDRHVNSLHPVIENGISSERSNFLLVNLSVCTNHQRREVIQLSKTKWSSFCNFLPTIPSIKCDSIPSFTNGGNISVPVTDPKFYDIFKTYKFVASPFGAGLDCHRTWEALYLGVVPIVKRSSIDGIFEGLPVIFVDKWSEVTEEFLNSEHKSLMSTVDFNFVKEKLTLKWWTSLIES